MQKFNSWIDYTLKESKEKNKISIIINKSDYTLYLIEKEKYIQNIQLNLEETLLMINKRGEIPHSEGLYKVSKKLNRDKLLFIKDF